MRKHLVRLSLAASLAGSGFLQGCKGGSPPAPVHEPATRAVEPAKVEGGHAPTTLPCGSEVVARVNGVPITRAELEQPLVEGYGLSILLNVIQLELAKQQVERQGLKVDPRDVQGERDRTLSKMFNDASKSDYDQLLDQFVRQQHISRPEFELVVQTNAYLRKLAEQQTAGKITDEAVRIGFSQLYGENRQIRDIEVANMREAQVARQRVDAGEPFEKVAQEMSNDRRTAAMGGELPQFSQQAQNIPKVIIDAAFSLKPGQVSDALIDGTRYHIIKLMSIIPPKIMKFEDVKDSVRQLLEEQYCEYVVKELRSQLAQLAMQTMQIDEPALKEQWNRRLEQQHSSIHDRDSALQELNRSHQNATTAPATVPASPSASAPAPPAPTSAASGQPLVVERPPATMPGVAAPGTLPVPAPAAHP